ncbi:MAG TPA: murein transglycosylase domain-containing protein [Burkholderiales bacterium]|nr:murein transglycosylase domain-containing protein [Burkholderiales bacterium]
MNKLLPAISICLLAGGCQTFDKTLDSADRAVAAAKSPSAKTITDIAKSDDREAVIREGLKRRADLYERDPQAAINDLKGLRREYDNLVAILTGNVNRNWGKKETKLPARTSYVKYTQNYRSRAIVDFDAGNITVETVDDKDPKASLRNAIVTTLLTPDDPRAVDLFSDKQVTLSSAKDPYLLGLVQDQHGKPVSTPAQAEAFADYLLDKQAAKRKVEVQEGAKDALFVSIAMVANFQNKQAEKYRDVVNKYAAQYKVSPSLVFAVIRTESNFNPFAVSSAPAYGMMQLVPSSGGREAFRAAKGRDEAPTKEYLFDAGNNIELGTAYLGVLGSKQLDYVTNTTSREYCVISAYNTGPSNVLKAFSKDKVAAVNSINGLEPPGVYEKLRTNLPYEETRQYLVKVTGYRKQFLSFGK